MPGIKMHQLFALVVSEIIQHFDCILVAKFALLYFVQNLDAGEDDRDVLLYVELLKENLHVYYLTGHVKNN